MEDLDEGIDVVEERLPEPKYVHWLWMTVGQGLSGLCWK
jgi:hypothetical protein